MKTDGLEKWLYFHTNISHFFNSDNELIMGNLEFNLDISYLTFNKLSSVYYNAVLEDLKKNIIKLYNLDDESLELITTERLIHPVLLAQHLQQELINMETEFNTLIDERLLDTEETLNMIHI